MVKYKDTSNISKKHIAGQIFILDKEDGRQISIFKSVRNFSLMVEAAGIEPASENIPLQFLHTCPLF